MKKRIIASLLAILMGATLFLTTGCSSYIMTANGEKMDAGYYSFYVHWQRDYYKELLKEMGYDINAYIDNPYSDTETVRETIVSTAKTQYLNYVVVSRKFDKLGLSLTDEQWNGIETQYEEDWITIYGEKGMKNILKTLGLKKEEFLNLLAVQAKSDAILDYYYGEKGVTPITTEDKKEYYKENYYRFKYVLLSTIDEKDKALPDDVIANKKALANEIVAKVQQGEAFENLIPLYSEDYSKITDDMSAEDKASAEASNEDAVKEGIICDSNGIFDQILYSYYDVCVNGSIISKLKETQIGDMAIVETDTAIWVIKEYDLNEDQSYFAERETQIYQKMYSADFNGKYTRWLAELDYKFDEDTLKELDPGTFTDLFSEVYNKDKTA